MSWFWVCWLTAGVVGVGARLLSDYADRKGHVRWDAFVVRPLGVAAAILLVLGVLVR